MPRMAEKIAGTLAPKRASDAMGHSIYDRKLSTASRLYGNVGGYPSSVISVRQSHSGTFLQIFAFKNYVLAASDAIEENDLIAIIQEANMDGVRHLRARSSFTRYVLLPF